jgi:hypothetical protein
MLSIDMRRDCESTAQGLQLLKLLPHDLHCQHLPLQFQVDVDTEKQA